MRDRPDHRFQFRLALALGMPVEEMLDRMTWREYLEWGEYYGLEPWGEERGDLRSGIVASVIANVNRDAKKQPKAFEPVDFMPYYEKPKPTPEQLAHKIRAALGGYR
jgi:hypothetical protein